MKKTSFLKMALAAIALSCSTATFAEPTPSPDLKDILGGAGGALGNIVEGVFTKTDLTVADIAGEWTSTGSAVSFQSDNFLKKAGGTAAAGAVESKLDEYYSKFGLTGATLEIDKDGNFTLTIKKLPLKGTLSVKDKGIFHFVFNAGGMMKLGSMTAYVEKTPTGLNVMFDADKIKKIMTLAATLSGSKMVSTADKLLQEYDGICIGFKMKGQSAASDDSSTGTSVTNTAVDALKGLFGK
ncbi:MAG: DUF4923 family protein [Muribaculaceae bacterium]|nr:DUF4923 family protein [Bacteroides sp.]MDE5848070.1 DUF4923 family protein [Muribaculaceae bacterium]MDE6194854.1 DUF4923 family protein [Muribaculaceae bacterium]